MKMKKTLALLMAMVMSLNLWACSSTDKTWAMKYEDTVIPIGSYVYNFYTAVTNASYREDLDPEVSMLDQEIEGMPAEDWIRQQAIKNTKMMIVMDQLMEEYDLSFSADEKKGIESLANTGWAQISSTLGSYVAKASFQKAYSELNYKYTKVFKAIYMEGGEKEVSFDEIEKYVIDNFTDYSYVCGRIYDSNFNVMEDSEQRELRSYMQDLATRINKGELTIEKAGEEYEEKFQTSDSMVNGVATLEAQGDNQEIIEALKKTENNKACFVDLIDESGACFVLYKRDIAKTAKDHLVEEDDLLTVLDEIRGEEYAEMVEGRVDALTDVEINEAALNDYKASSYYTFTPPVSSSETDLESDNSEKTE